MSIQASLTKLLLRPYFRHLLRQPYLAQRQMQEKFNRMSSRIPNGTEFEAITIDAIPAEWVRSTNGDPDRVILYFHGGAYVAGSIVTHRDFAAHITQATGIPILLVDYRLAPEHPHPAAIIHQ